MSFVAELATSSLAVAAALLAVYRVVPPAPVTSPTRGPLRVAAALACQVAVSGFAIYAARIADFNAAYGSLGTVFAFLVLVYVLAIIVLAGRRARRRPSGTAREG